MRRFATALWSAALAFALGCANEHAASGPPRDSEASEPARASALPPEAQGEAISLGVPPRTIHRARLEARGLSRMTESLRARALASGRESGSPSYAELVENSAELEGARVSYEGNLGLVRPAGPRLWIIALRTRRAGERWVDPLYVLSVVDPALPEDREARIDGWVVGERTIGRHTLPLVVAFHIAPAR